MDAGLKDAGASSPRRHEGHEGDEAQFEIKQEQRSAKEKTKNKSEKNKECSEIKR
jgi:hypothetical protein